MRENLNTGGGNSYAGYFPNYPSSVFNDKKSSSASGLRAANRHAVRYPGPMAFMVWLAIVSVQHQLM